MLLPLCPPRCHLDTLPQALSTGGIVQLLPVTYITENRLGQKPGAVCCRGAWARSHEADSFSGQENVLFGQFYEQARLSPSRIVGAWAQLLLPLLSKPFASVRQIFATKLPGFRGHAR